jgi:outer membrane protein OmpA-like peptidoglycan-associated protein
VTEQDNRPGNSMSNIGDSWLSKLAVAIAAAFLIAIIVVGYLVLARLGGLEEEFGKIDARIQRTQEDLEEVRRTSEHARDVAEDAEEAAQIASQGRQHAETLMSVSEERARQAEEDALQAKEEAAEEITKARREREAEINRLHSALNQIAETRRTALGLVMNLGSDMVQFDFDKAVLRTEDKELLSKIAGVLLTSDGYRIQVWGHTDDVGSEQYNQELSERRAESVLNYLVESGIDPRIVSMKGLGKSNPLVPGTSRAARAKNRRVEIGIVDTFVRYDRTVTE